MSEYIYTKIGCGLETDLYRVKGGYIIANYKTWEFHPNWTTAQIRMEQIGK